METVKIVMSIIYCTKYESIVPFPITSELECERKLPNCVFKLGVHPSVETSSRKLTNLHRVDHINIDHTYILLRVVHFIIYIIYVYILYNILFAPSRSQPLISNYILRSGYFQFYDYLTS